MSDGPINPKTKDDWDQYFQRNYIDILKRGNEITIKSDKEKSLLQINEEALDNFKKAFTLDSNSIEFLPAYFNIIECYFLKQNCISDIKKYLIVGLTNLENAQKKKDDKGFKARAGQKEIEEEKKKKLLKSRLELLFARLNLTTDDLSSAIAKLQNSIISYSEIYGPEDVGLTPQYFFLAEYFWNNSKEELETRKIKVKQIYLKIADIWRQFFGPLNSDNPPENSNLLLAIGEYYIKKMISNITRNFQNMESELQLKCKMIQAGIYLHTGNEYYSKTYESSLKIYNELKDKIIDKEFMEEMNFYMKGEEEEN